MIPKRVFSPSLTIKSLTSENRLKGNRRFDCDSQASSASSTSSTNTKHKPSSSSLDPIKEATASIEYDKKTIGNTNIENGKNINDKNHFNTNRLHNDVSRREKDKTLSGHHHQHNSTVSKSNNVERVNNLIGTQDVIVENGNCQNRNSIHIGQNERDGIVNEIFDEIELSVRRINVETKINNVPLRDVIQRKVTKLPNQLLNSSKELSTKLVTAATSTTSKNVSRTKRLLFRRKTTAITKDQIDVAKHLQKKTITTQQNNEVYNNESTLDASQVKVPTVDSNYSRAIDTIEATNKLEAIQQQQQQQQHPQQQQQQQYHQGSTSAKQKQANNITIVTNLQNAKRKNAKIENKYKLDDVNKNGVNNVILTNDNVSTSKRYYLKQLPAANKIKTEHFPTTQTQTQTKSDTNSSYNIHENFFIANSNSLNEKKTLKPPPYIDPPLPKQSLPHNIASTFTFNKQTNHFTSCELQTKFKNNKTESDSQNVQVDVINDDCIDDEHGNYAVPYVQSPTNLNVKTLTTVVNSSVHIRIANQFKTKVNSYGTEKETQLTKSQNYPENRAPLSHQNQVQSQCKDNKDSSHVKSAIETEILLLKPIGQSFSSGSNSSSGGSSGVCNNSNSNGSGNNSCTTSTDSSNTTSSEYDKNTNHNNRNETNQKMDPTKILNLTSPCDMLTKPKFSSSHLQNIPVRPRKGIPHLENYCLFDPSKDFVNEKELKKKYGLVSGDCMPFPIKILDKRTNEEELIKETIYEDHDFVYDTLEDVKEEDEEENDEMSTVYPNYFTIDPDYIEVNKMESSLLGNANHLHPIVEIVESETDDFYSDTNANVNKMNNIYGNHSAPKQQSETHVLLEKSPQIGKKERQASQPVISTFAAKKMNSSTGGGKLPPNLKHDSSNTTSKPQNPKVRTKLSPPTDLSLRTTNQMAIKVATKKQRNNITMKHSISTPQLSQKDLFEENLPLPVVETDVKNVPTNKSAVIYTGNRANPYKIIRRPASQHSDADSGFLSPTSDAFLHIETIEGYIEVSHFYKLSITFHSFDSQTINKN